MLRARYIDPTDQEGYDCLIAVFDQGTSLQDLQPLAREVVAIPFAECATALVGIGTLAHRLPVLCVRLRAGGDWPSAAAKVKEITNPVLPYTLSRLTYRLRICNACSYPQHVVYSGDLAFVPGLEPKDDQRFLADYGKKLARLPITHLIQEHDPTFKRLIDELEKLLAELGTFTSSIFIHSFEFDNGTCTHQM